MYIPKYFEETDIGILHELMMLHPLATVVTSADGELVVNHLPLLIYGGENGENEKFGVLRGHVARANPLWRQFTGAADAVAVFQGPQAYISPSWYPSKHLDGKQVPTWNYAVVHAHGSPRIIEDANWLYAHLNDMTDKHESEHALPWKVSDAPKDFTDKLLNAIVGIEMPIARIEGKWKVSQNRARGDRLGVAAGLASRSGEQPQAMANIVMERLGSEASAG
jgi:transcriptional regulator